VRARLIRARRGFFRCGRGAAFCGAPSIGATRRVGDDVDLIAISERIDHRHAQADVSPQAGIISFFLPVLLAQSSRQLAYALDV
jgi:hypothetical protein